MVFTDLTIYAHDKTINNGWIEISNGKIKSYGSGKKRGVSLKGMHIVPGFIDVHFHGSFGIDLMSAEQSELKKLSSNLLKYGVTSYLATTLTDSLPILNKALNRLSKYITNQTNEYSQMVGIHLEGPFISPKYPGAQDQKYIIKPNLAKFKSLNKIAKNKIKYVTFAPELDNGEFVKYLASNKIVASAGHSAASMQQIDLSIKNGLTNITHFNNAHSPFHHRNLGILNAGFEYDKLNVELIVDKLHVHPSVVKLVSKIKTPDRILLITDACMATQLKDGKYKLGSQAVIKTKDSVRLLDGTLAASLLTMNVAFKNMFELSKRSLSEIVLMASTNQAKLLNLKDRGMIKNGLRADLVIVNDKLEVVMTLLNGKIVYEKDKLKKEDK
jgi:N-acetylglucosamine-6-phosphate deacetylase